MSNALMDLQSRKYETPTALALSEISSYAQIFASSGYFSDVRDVAQAAVKIIFGAEYGLSPAQAMSAIYIVKGKPSLSAQSMVGLAKRAGYGFKTLEHTDKICIIQVFDRYGQECGPPSEFTYEDALRAGTGADSQGGAGMLKKFPKNMLWARAASNACRWYCSDVFTGPVYTPEELGARTDSEGEYIPEVKQIPTKPIAKQDSRTQEEEPAQEQPASNGIGARRKAVSLAFIGEFDERIIPQLTGRDFAPAKLNKKTGQEEYTSLEMTFGHMSAADLDAVEAFMKDGTIPELELSEA